MERKDMGKVVSKTKEHKRRVSINYLYGIWQGQEKKKVDIERR